MSDRRVTAEIARLADRRPDPPRRPQRGGEVSSDSDDAPAARGELICDSMYLLPFSNRLPTNVATQPVPLPTPATRGAADTDGGDADGCGLLEQALPLLREVYAHVCTRHTGRIDWHAIAASLNEHRACAACAADAAADGPAPQRKLPPPLCAAAVRRLWRAVAYSRAEEEVGDAPETSDSHRVARSALLARIGGAVASHAAGESDDASDIEGYLLSERQRQSLTQQSVVDDLAARRKGTPRLAGSAFPPPPGLLPPPPPADGSGPLDLGLEPPRKKSSARDNKDDTHTLKEAMRLTVSSRPWSEDDDRKLAALVARHGPKGQEALEKAMRRSWGAIRSRIQALQTKGAIPRPGDAAAAAAASAAAGGAGGKPSVAKGGGGGKARKAAERPSLPGDAQLRRTEGGLVALEATAVDAKLWAGAAAAGWTVVEMYAGGGKSGNWKYISPAGVPCKSRSVAIELGGDAAQAAAAAGREKKAAERRAQGQPERGPALTKSRAKELVGRLVEVYWDGEDAWYKAEVLRFDEASRAHTLRYTADGYECEEKLSDSSWRGPLPRPTARTAAKRSREG